MKGANRLTVLCFRLWRKSDWANVWRNSDGVGEFAKPAATLHTLILVQSAVYIIVST